MPIQSLVDTRAVHEARLWTMTIPVISTGHVTNDTRLLLEQGDNANTWCHVAPYEFGWFVSVPSEDPTTPDDPPPGDLLALWKWAREHGHDWVRLDADGDDVEGMPLYEWSPDIPQ